MLPPEVIRLCRSSPGELVTVRQLARLGVRRQQVAAMVSAGDLERVLHGVCVEAGRVPPDSRELILPSTYLGLRAPEHHPMPLLTGGRALAWDGVPLLDRRGVPEVLVHADCRARATHLPFSVWHVQPHQFLARLVRGVPLADLGRCVADLARDDGVTALTLRLAVDEIRRRGLATEPSLVRRWDGIRHDGAQRLLDMAAAGDFEQESEGERDAFRLLFTAHPPLPDCQVVYGRRRVDFAYIAAGLTIEYHGRVHDRSVDEDAVRTHELEGLGLREKVVTKSLLGTPATVASAIHDLRRHREELVRTGRLVLPRLGVQPERLRPLRTLLSLG